MDSDFQFVRTIKQEIWTTLSALEERNEQLAGYALLTDDDLETLGYAALSTDMLRSSSDEDLLFQPTDWPFQGEPDAFDGAYAELLARARSAVDFRAHVDTSFAILVRALAEAKAEGLFDAKVFLSVLSTDPSEHLLALENSAISQPNESAILQNRQRFLDKWR